MKSETSPTSGTRSKGFTLLEVLISVAILAVALTAIIQAFSQSFFSLNRSERYAIATLQAQSKLAEVGPIIPIEPGFHSGEFDNGFVWEVGIEEALLPLPLAGGADGSVGVNPNDLQAFRVQVSVNWAEDQGVNLDSLRVANGR